MGGSSANDLVRLIRDKQALIQRLQAELDEARALLDETFGVGQLAMPALLPGRPKRGRPKGSRSRSKPEAGNSVKWAETVLRESGQRPLHVNEIIARIARRFSAPVQYSTLVGNLSRLVKAKRTFTRYGPNVFGLLEWREKENVDEEV